MGRLNTGQIRELKKSRKIVAITAYDYLFAKLVDKLVDIVLVGDSLGMVIQGLENTLPVTINDMIYHSKAVSRALLTAHLVVDMPFLSYQVSTESAIENAGRLLKEGGSNSVKLEGGVTISELVRKLVMYGIPVMGHIGLTPQSVNVFGGYKIQGKTKESQERILDDALALEDAGVYSIVLEGMPEELAAKITEKLSIPTIGIGAGRFCDGQILVIQDMLGLNEDFNPKFVKRFSNLSEEIKKAVFKYSEEVKNGSFPGKEHTF